LLARRLLAVGTVVFVGRALFRTGHLVSRELRQLVFTQRAVGAQLGVTRDELVAVAALAALAVAALAVRPPLTALALVAVRDLAHGVRKERHLTGNPDRARDFALLLGVIARDAARADLRSLSNDTPEEVTVLVVDTRYTLRGEGSTLILR